MEIKLSEEQNKQERYVAYFDMLGFKSATLRDPAKSWIALTEIKHCIDRILKTRIEILASKTIISDRIKGFNISDGIIIFTAQDTEYDLAAILMLSTELFSSALHKSIPLRGAICHGEFFFNLSERLFGGVPFVKAYDLERCADWSGIIVDEHVVTRYQKNPFPLTEKKESILVDWLVPTKEGKAKRAWVINWPEIHRRNFNKRPPITIEEYYKAFENLFGRYADLPENVQAKYKNTLEFINAKLTD